MKTNPKPGTPFIYFAVVAPLVVTGVIVLVPSTGIPFDFSMQFASIFVVSINLGFLTVPIFLNPFFDRIPDLLQWLNPILILCHLCILAGGVALNRGKSKLGSRLIILACAVIIMFVALGYLIAIGTQGMARADLPDDLDWTVTFGLVAPLFYLIPVLVALIGATNLLGAHRFRTGVR